VPYVLTNLFLAILINFSSAPPKVPLHEEGQPLKEGEYDGMEDMLGDTDILPTDYDVMIEDPPHKAWFEKVDAEGKENTNGQQ
jgi:hypothetical protein